MNPENHARAQEPLIAPQQERRRSQRVTLRIPVRLHVTLQGNEKVSEAFTVNVNDHGALIVSEQLFALNDRFTLEHKHTRNRIACHVTRKPQETPSGYQVAVEFEKAAPGFWNIAFPPLDWKPTD